MSSLVDDLQRQIAELRGVGVARMITPVVIPTTEPSATTEPDPMDVFRAIVREELLKLGNSTEVKELSLIDVVKASISPSELSWLESPEVQSSFDKRLARYFQSGVGRQGIRDFFTYFRNEIEK